LWLLRGRNQGKGWAAGSVIGGYCGLDKMIPGRGKGKSRAPQPPPDQILHQDSQKGRGHSKRKMLVRMPGLRGLGGGKGGFGGTRSDLRAAKGGKKKLKKTYERGGEKEKGTWGTSNGGSPNPYLWCERKGSKDIEPSNKKSQERRSAPFSKPDRVRDRPIKQCG